MKEFSINQTPEDAITEVHNYGVLSHPHVWSYIQWLLAVVYCAVFAINLRRSRSLTIVPDNLQGGTYAFPPLNSNLALTL